MQELSKFKLAGARCGDFTMGRMLINATKPFHWRDKFAIANNFSAEKRDEIWEKWAPKLGLK